MSTYKPLVEGHRGIAARYPENTLISYEAALDLGVDAFEFDVWLTKDKVPVLMHDGNCLRTCKVDKHLRDMDLKEVKELDAGYQQKFGDKFMGQGIEVPTLEETLQLCAAKRPDIILGVEIKEYTTENVDITVELLKKYNMFDRCFFYAFHAPTLKYIKTRYNGRTMGYPDFQMKEFEKDSYSYYDEIGLSMSIVRSEICRFYLDKGFPVHMYCADTDDDVRLCMSLGAKLITANEPLPLMRAVGRI